jgi:hypothetical protein
MRAQRLRLAGALLIAIGACGGTVTTTPDARPVDAAQGGADAAAADATPGTVDAATVDAPPGAADARIDATAGPDAAAPDAASADAAAADATPPPPDAAPDAVVIDAAPVMSLVEVRPSAASRAVTTNLEILGFNIDEDATVVLDNCDTATEYDLTTASTVAGDGRSIATTLAALPTREQGLYSVIVTNPDGLSDTLTCAFLVSASAPPTVGNVTPNTAFTGAANDGLLSDALVSITGTGFEATPSVRWTSLDGRFSFQAQTVSFISPTQLTAVVPTETLDMPLGDYRVTVQNPDLLEGTWAGIFSVTGTAPPRITDIDPVRITNGSGCATPVDIVGESFHADADAYFMAPSTFGCAGGLADPSGNKLCPLNVSDASATEFTVNFTSCPGTGPWPLAVRNPDGQIGYWFSVEITPSAEGHLNHDDFVPVDASLVTARWKHAANHAFDVFGHAFLYVAGGQSAQRDILGSVEVSQLSLFGEPGPFAIAQQYGGDDAPRVDNSLALPRAGHTLLRAGKHLYAIGGSDAVTDTTAIVAGTASVERAFLLSYDEMPLMQRPTEIGASGLPRGTWYYQVSAIGPWGESLGSREVQVRTVGGGAIQICWSVAQSSTSYNVYRSLGSDGRSGTAALLATEVAPPCFMDTGSGALAPAPGRLRGGVVAGSLAAGTHSYRVAAVVDGEETQASYPVAIQVAANQDVVLNWDAVRDASSYVVYKLVVSEYRRLAAATGTTYTDGGGATTLVNPRAEIASLPPGSLSRWLEVPGSQFLTVPRDGVDGVVIRLEQEDTDDPIARLLVAGGRASNEESGDYHKTAESILVSSSGALTGVWELEEPVFDTARAFFALLTTQDRNVTPFPPPPEEPPCPDADGDDYIACTCAPVGTVCDCDDTDPDINPGEEEICGDGIDQNCDGEDEECACTIDVDGDGWFSDLLCDGGDCCDSGNEPSLGCSAATADDVNPGATEVCGDGIDQDCDGVDPGCVCTLDEDGDGHLAEACFGDDCCDDGSEASLGCTVETAPNINPEVEEICGDAVDQDCDGVDPGCVCEEPDADGDGHDSLACGGDDCCDDGTEASVGCRPATAPGIFPGNPEICGDGIDQNCNGTDLICKRPLRAPAVAGDEQVWVIAVQGAPGITRGGSTSTQVGLETFESCRVDMSTGRLDCPETWITQDESVPASGAALGNDAVLYFNFLYPFTGAKSEVTTFATSSRDLSESSISRFALNLPSTTGQVLGNRQSASTSVTVARSHFQLVRLMSYIFHIGGIGDAGPSDLVERHLQ